VRDPTSPGIDIQGGTESITIRDNIFTESRGGQPHVLVKHGGGHGTDRRQGQEAEGIVIVTSSRS
jgi:hypothetical protein